MISSVWTVTVTDEQYRRICEHICDGSEIYRIAFEIEGRKLSGPVVAIAGGGKVEVHIDTIDGQFMDGQPETRSLQ